ncbi:MAG: DUF4159 domain-containing protein [Hyphomicrobiaceae bacterium]
MSIGALAFLNPWLLAGLVALPLIYWLLRTVPPSPRQVEFPPTRILVGLDNREKTPHKTPWWLMLIRLLAAALIILALAEPVLNPDRGNALKDGGPVALVVDNGWSAAAAWSERSQMVDRLIDEAESRGRPLVVIATAGAANVTARIEAPGDARIRAAAMTPESHPPNRKAAVDRLKAAIGTRGDASVVWLSDGIDHGHAAEFIATLSDLAQNGLTIVETGEGNEALGVRAGVGKGGRLDADVLRAHGGPREGLVLALSGRGERLGEARFKLAPGEKRAAVSFDMPLELRNQVSRIALATERSAGAVSLMDARTKWNRIGLLSGTAREEAQPLLDPLYYIRKAVGPFAELTETDDANLASGLKSILAQKPSILILADIGTIADKAADDVKKWTENGGVLVRFAGPRLEKGGDELLPIPLRLGGRELGGALSWSTPQPLAEFGDDSLFSGLDVPPEVLIRRQVLADPTRLGPGVDVWARLKDGTPLVTASKAGEGQIVLFHVTANTKWSNLPISGLFVNMLRRLATLGKLGGGAQSGDTLIRDGVSTRETAQSVLPPIQVLDGYGALRPPPPTAQAVPRAKFDKAKASIATPPGYYGAAGRPRALNVIAEKMELKPLPSLPVSARRRAYEGQTSTPLKPWFLGAALGLLFVDVIAIMLLAGGGLFTRRRSRAASSATAMVMVLTGAAAFTVLGGLISLRPAIAQTNVPQSSSSTKQPTAKELRDDQLALRITSRVTFGYVMTGETTGDATSEAGLAGLVKVLTARTAVEPGEPVGVNIERDEIAFFPLLYWPVTSNTKQLATPVLAKIDAYMKQGGMIIFDTQDYGQGIPFRLLQRSDADQQTPLQRLIGRLDIPRLEPVAEGHVLTKSFYLLRSFPGRWDGGQLWVEAGGASSSEGSDRKSRVDGVSSILVTSNDLASAWALDDRNLPMFPVVPGGERQREMAYRTGINIVMYALTGNYKADQVHIPALLERLGQ